MTNDETEGTDEQFGFPHDPNLTQAGRGSDPNNGAYSEPRRMNPFVTFDGSPTFVTGPVVQLPEVPGDDAEPTASDEESEAVDTEPDTEQKPEPDAEQKPEPDAEQKDEPAAKKSTRKTGRRASGGQAAKD